MYLIFSNAPFYFRYTLSETFDYYKSLADRTSRPVLVYANPQTATGMDINAVVAELLKIENVCGVKDTRANYYQLWRLKQLEGGDINVINGPDESLLCGLMMGNKFARAIRFVTAREAARDKDDLRVVDLLGEGIHAA